MDKLLDAYNQQNLKQEDINHSNRHKTSNEVEVVVKSILTKKSPVPGGFMAEFYQTLKKS
jgi:hypothetical protein